MKQWERDLFSLTGFEETSEEIYEGIHNPSIRWNGWCMPYLTTEAAQQLVDDLRKETNRPNIEDGDLNIIREGEVFFEEWQDVKNVTHLQAVQTITIDGETFHAIGAGSWCWDEATMEDGTSYLCDNCEELLEECYPTRNEGKCIG